MADTRLAAGIEAVAALCLMLWGVGAWRRRHPEDPGEWVAVCYEWECTETLPSGYKRWRLVELQQNVLAESEFRTNKVRRGDTDYPTISRLCNRKPSEVSDHYRLRIARG